MGIFDKKLDYSEGNGSLPWLNSEAYSPLVFPSSATILVPSLNLAEREKKQGKYGYFLELVFKNYQSNEENKEVIKLVEKYLSAFCKRTAAKLNPEAIQNVGRYMAVGISFAKVENGSTLQIENKVHPSVLNALFSLVMDLNRDSETKAIFSEEKNYTNLLELAMRIGYTAERFGGTLTAQEMLKNIGPLD
jgi:hypothetical protein